MSVAVPVQRSNAGVPQTITRDTIVESGRAAGVPPRAVTRGEIVRPAPGVPARAVTRGEVVPSGAQASSVRSPDVVDRALPPASTMGAPAAR